MNPNGSKLCFFFVVVVVTGFLKEDGCTPNSVPMVFIVFSRNCWEL